MFGSRETITVVGRGRFNGSTASLRKRKLKSPMRGFGTYRIEDRNYFPTPSSTNPRPWKDAAGWDFGISYEVNDS